jgi:hypothetical protein
MPPYDLSNPYFMPYASIADVVDTILSYDSTGFQNTRDGRLSAREFTEVTHDLGLKKPFAYYDRLGGMGANGFVSAGDLGLGLKAVADRGVITPSGAQQFAGRTGPQSQYSYSPFSSPYASNGYPTSNMPIHNDHGGGEGVHTHGANNQVIPLNSSTYGSPQGYGSYGYPSPQPRHMPTANGLTAGDITEAALRYSGGGLSDPRSKGTLSRTEFNSLAPMLGLDERSYNLVAMQNPYRRDGKVDIDALVNSARVADRDRDGVLNMQERASWNESLIHDTLNRILEPILGRSSGFVAGSNPVSGLPVNWGGNYGTLPHGGSKHGAMPYSPYGNTPYGSSPYGTTNSPVQSLANMANSILETAGGINNTMNHSTGGMGAMQGVMANPYGSNPYMNPTGYQTPMVPHGTGYGSGIPSYNTPHGDFDMTHPSYGAPTNSYGYGGNPSYSAPSQNNYQALNAVISILSILPTLLQAVSGGFGRGGNYYPNQQHSMTMH